MAVIKILCVEDNDDDFELLSGLLENISAQNEKTLVVERAQSGELAHAYAAVADYDLFIVDFRLEGIDSGADFIRRLHIEKPGTPAILLSGLPELEVGREILSAIGTGRVAFMQKRHLDQESLRLQIKSMLRKPMRLLVVDDDSEDYDLARTVLQMSEAYRFEVDWADSVAAACDQLDRNSYDGFLVDYHLNHESGIDFVQECVQRRESVKPVLLLTGHNDLDDDRAATRLLERDNICLVSKHHMDTAHLVQALEQTGHWKGS